jgi:hypothetical protein
MNIVSWAVGWHFGCKKSSSLKLEFGCLFLITNHSPPRLVAFFFTPFFSNHYVVHNFYTVQEKILK